MQTRTTDATTTRSQGVHQARTAGRWLLAGGAAWVVAAIIGGEDGSGRFYAAELVWLLSQLALLAGTWLLWRSGPHGPSRAGATGFGIAVVGRVLFVVAEAAALVTGETQDALLPAAALPAALGMVLAGAAVVRARQWAAPARFVPLAVGVLPFAVMFPFAALADGPPTAALVAWGLAFVGLGGAAQHSDPA